VFAYNAGIERLHSSHGIINRNACSLCEPLVGQRVCGTDGHTYFTLCHAVNCAGLTEKQVVMGACTETVRQLIYFVYFNTELGTFTRVCVRELIATQKVSAFHNYLIVYHGRLLQGELYIVNPTTVVCIHVYSGFVHLAQYIVLTNSVFGLI